MLPSEVSGPVQAYIEALRGDLGHQLAGVYAVGSLALADFSHRQSNVDLVLVTDPPLDPARIEPLRRHEKRMARGGRRAEVWYTTWAEIADGPDSHDSPTAALATPMTWAILRSDPLAIIGPDWPVVWGDANALRAWARQRLREIVDAAHGLLVMRHDVSPLVLEVARLAQVVLGGKVLSKSEAGETLVSVVPKHYRRILTDSVGYRQGAQFSMYWGPFERKYDALALLRDVAELAGAHTDSGTGAGPAAT
jgi:hypothetical protein